MSLTTAQRKALAIAPKVSASCSLFLSGCIVWTVLSDAKKRKSPYHRLLCGISIVDMSTSFWGGLTTWPIPSDSGVMYAAGNEASCQVQGFWLQFAIASAFYNGSLSIYYLLLVRYGWRQARFRQSRIEWLFHAVPIAFGLGTASLALGADTLGNAFFWCWITSANPAYRWAVYYGPLWLIIVMVTAICWVMHRHVQRIEKETLQHIHKKNSNSSNNQQRLPSANPTLNDDSEVETLSVVSQSPPYSQAALTSSGRDNSSSRRPAWSEGFPASVLDRTTTAGRAASINNPYSSAGSIPNDSEDESNAANDAESPATRTVPEQPVRQPPTTRFMRPTATTHVGGDGTTATFSEKKKELRRAKQVSRLCFQYAAAFYLNWSAVSCIRMIQIFDPDFVNFGLFLVATFLVAIQGLPNFLIYLGPQVWKGMKQRRQRQRKQQEQQSQDREHSQQGRPRDVLRQMSGSGTPSQERQHRSFLMATLAESIGESPPHQQHQVPPNVLSAKGEDAESAMAEARKRASAAIARHRQRIGATDDDDFENDGNDHVDEETEKGSKNMDNEWGTTSVMDVKHSMDPVVEEEDFLMEEEVEAEDDQDTMSVDSQSRRSANGVEFVDEE